MTDRPLDPDRRPSRRLGLAAVLVARGEDPERVAQTCGVPMAFLDLIREEAAFTRSSTVRGTVPRPRREE